MILQPVNLFFQVHGQGEPLIILHGLLGSSANWTTTCELLGRQFQVISVDLRNHGNSPHCNEFNFQVMVEDLKYLLERQNLQQAIVLGHSFGGRVAMEFADRYPEMVSKLIVVDVAPKAYPPVHNDLIDALLAVDLDKYASVREVVSALAVAIPSQQMRNFLAKSIYLSSKRGLCCKANLLAIRENMDKLCDSNDFKNSYIKPVLFITGELSDYVLSDDEVTIRKIYPHCQFETILGAGHWVHIDAKSNFIDAVSKFAT